MDASDPTQTFLIEAADLLAQVEETVLEIANRPDDREAINRLFRAFHTIKGSGAMFGFEAVASFTHHVETALDQLRQGTIGVSPELVRLILAARDHIQRLLEAGAGEASSPDEAGEALAREFTALLAGTPAAPVAQTGVAPAPEHGATQTFDIHFRPEPGIAMSGLDPAALLAELQTLGRCEITADTGAVPGLEELSATKCHLAWDIHLVTDRGLNAVRDVFVFAEDGAELRITDVTETMAAPVAAPATTAPVPVDDAAASATANGVTPDDSRGSAARAARDAVVRVPSAKLDHLVSLVGELVMNESRLSQVASRLNQADLAGPVEAMERLIAEMRDAVLGIRMMPIGSTFSRFKRLVYDLSHDLGKEVDLVTEGAETELDKTVLDQLADPLVHLIRNSIDHGIGTPGEREALGRPRRGTVRLTARHEGSHVVVTVQDDGRGLDPALIRAKAVEKGLIGADANLSEAEIFNLIFLPGFSTANKVTAVSGRGVGMDVVRKQIDALRGGIQLSSTKGEGTTIALSLPLTLAIIEGLLVTVADDPFIIPMSVVSENVELRREDRARNNGRNLVSVRGELIPYLHLRELFGLPGEEPAIEKIVIVRFGRDRVGLVVDRVLGSHQTVIQSLGRMFRKISVVSGGTIMGDGRVALILDLAGLVACAQQRNGAEVSRPIYAAP
ncbi:chemotaxis protein CheA [Opitutus sp. ER46]|uniref:chemotaxis protein CheA n=1 Tax=Opitutus sp. ER46 TaxID=2161864 RepID=UPI000D321A6E|nr:chemotaxis protein CheA [Opitutus sp. ER46]PTX99098.1 chemotaxis protein CheA [Opitutus sp. ER46]